MKTFIFDLYNTLINIRTDEWSDNAWAPLRDTLAQRNIDCSTRRLAFLFHEMWQLLEYALTSKHGGYVEVDMLDVFERMSNELGANLTQEEIADCAKQMRLASTQKFCLFDGTLQLLDDLKARGARIYLLSNAQTAFTPDEIKRAGLEDKFDGVLLSSTCGVRKPDARFFEILFERYNLNKEDCVMIGDSKESDIDGANAYGIQSLWTPNGASAIRNEILALCK